MKEVPKRIFTYFCDTKNINQYIQADLSEMTIYEDVIEDSLKQNMELQGFSRREEFLKC